MYVDEKLTAMQIRLFIAIYWHDSNADWHDMVANCCFQPLFLLKIVLMPLLLYLFSPFLHVDWL